MHIEMENLEKLIKEAEDLANKIQIDASRKQLPSLLLKLVELSALLGEKKRDYVKAKVSLALLEPTLKSKYREKAEIDKIKLTIDALDTMLMMDDNFRDTYENKGENEETVAYLDPLIRSYYELINGWKFIDRETIQATKTFNSYEE